MSRTLRTTGVLLADQTSDAIFLLADRNGDGRAVTPGEITLYFGAGNASGFATPTRNVFTLLRAADGAVFAGDGDSDTVWRLVDRNRDGDAEDAGEATAWLTAIPGPRPLVTPNGLAQGPDGAIYIVNAGVSSQPADVIYRTIDLNGDGDATDDGEWSVWLDISLVTSTSAPFEISFAGEVAYLLDPNGAGEDTIWRIRDADGSGTISADEVTAFATKTATGAPIDFAMDAEANGDVLVWQWLADGDSPHALWRLSDRDGSGAIDQADEAAIVWTAARLPSGASAEVGFSVVAGGDGRVALTSNGRAAGSRLVVVLDDINNDGDFLDDGETTVFGNDAELPGFLQRPRAVEFLPDTIVQPPTLASGGNHFSLFLDPTTNTVYAAGENVLAQLGIGTVGFDIAAPVPVTLPEGFNETIVSVAAGLIHGSFITESGALYTWGFGNFGRLGLNSTDNALIPTRVLGELENRRVVVADHGNGSSHVITADGALWSFGQNTNGQLGVGDTTNRLVPTRVGGALADKTVVAVSSGTSHTLALTADGEVYAFGRNQQGQLGQGAATPTQITAPVRVNGLPNDIIAVTADTLTSYAVTADGRVFGWGEAKFGQLLLGTSNGDGTFTPQRDNALAPVELTALPDGIVDIRGGARWVAALTADGQVWVWGPNDEGIAGGLDGDPAAIDDTVSFLPRRLPGTEDLVVREIATGPNHLMLVTQDGRHFTLGSNSDGRLAYVTAGSTTVPREVEFDGDAGPFLVSVTPADNGSGVAADQALVLTFTEAVTVAEGGTLTLVNRDDAGDRQVIDLTQAALISGAGVPGAGRVVTVTPHSLLTPGARYAIQITDGAFIDASGQGWRGFAAGDTSSWNFTVATDALPGDPVVATGTDRAEALRGGAGADRLAGAGGDDWLSGGAGNDTLDGGAGTDTAVLRGGPVALVQTGDATFTATSSGGGTDTLTAIERVVLGAAAPISLGFQASPGSINSGASAVGLGPVDLGGFQAVQVTSSDDRIVFSDGQLRLEGLVTEAAGSTIDFTLTATDAAGNTLSRSFAVSVTAAPQPLPPANPAPINQAPRAVTLVDAVTALTLPATLATPLVVGRIRVSDDGRGENRLGLSGEDAGAFAVVDDALVLRAGPRPDGGGDGVLEVTVTVDDPTVGATPDAAAQLRIAIAAAPGGATGPSFGEGQTAALVTVQAGAERWALDLPTALDGNGAPVTYRLQDLPDTLSLWLDDTRVTDTALLDDATLGRLHLGLGRGLGADDQPGDAGFTLVARDDQGGTASLAVTVSVSPARDDRLFGTSADEILDGAGGRDTLDLRRLPGAATVSLEQGVARGPDLGSDRLWGIESVFGGAADDLLVGDAGANRLGGAAGNDRVFGRDGQDSLHGHSGNDRLIGGSGHDRLEGGLGDDRLTGGDGADLFLFVVGTRRERDVITDFTLGDDRLELAVRSGDDGDAAAAPVFVQRGDTTVVVLGPQRIVLLDTDAAALQAADALTLI